jgi:hypothetical protein
MMHKKLFWLLTLTKILFVSSILTLISFTQNKGTINTIYNLPSSQVDADKKLNSIDVFNHDLSMQAKFTFSSFIDSKPSLKVNGNNLEIFFPNAQLGNLDKEAIRRKFYDTGLVEHVEFRNEPNIAGIIFNLTFFTDKVFITTKSIQNLNKSNFILEVYKKDDFRNILNSLDGPLFLSLNLSIY